MSAALDYNRAVAERPAVAVEQSAWLVDAFRRAGITFDGAPMATFLRPHFVEGAAWDRLRNDGRRLLELAVRVARRAYDGDTGRLCAFLGLSEAESRWVVVDPGEPDVVLSRLDAFLAAEGPRFIEINSDAPAGFGYGDRMAEVFRDLPFLREFARTHAIAYHASGERLVEAVVAVWRSRGGSKAPRVAIVDWADVKTRADQEILREAFVAKGVRCVLADPREMDIRDGRLRAGDDTVDVVYRRGVLSELVAREDEVVPFFTAYREGLAVFVNSLRCQLSEDKAFLALLTDEAFAFLLTPAERALVDRTVPWTRKLEERRTHHAGDTVDLIPYVLANRPRLVLKPAHGYGGRSVHVGEATDAGAWERAVADAVGAPWVVQERVPIPEEVFPLCDGGTLRFEPLKVNVNPFYVAGSDVGAVTRASRSAVINVSAGGGSVPTFVVSEP